MPKSADTLAKLSNKPKPARTAIEIRLQKLSAFEAKKLKKEQKAKEREDARQRDLKLQSLGYKFDDLSKVNKFIDSIKECAHSKKNLTDLETRNLSELISGLDADFIAKRQAHKILSSLKNSFYGKNLKLSLVLAEKLAGKLAPVANDHPFSTGDVVRVIRYRHGFNTNQLATITDVFSNENGTYFYYAKDSEGQFLEINHTRDAVLQSR